jgi:DNA-binding NarL/FixJ family response regulator
VVAADPRTLREHARARLAEAGVDVTRAAYQAAFAARTAADEQPSPLLTVRESQVLQLMARGLTYKGAAAELGVGWRTVQTHAQNAYAKLGVRSKIEALRVATELRLLPPLGS